MFKVAVIDQSLRAEAEAVVQSILTEKSQLPSTETELLVTELVQSLKETLIVELASAVPITLIAAFSESLITQSVAIEVIVGASGELASIIKSELSVREEKAELEFQAESFKTILTGVVQAVLSLLPSITV
ncbi:hypothetical protein HOG21_07195 [bacterium]|nr:hypothetical protein [bacterium]